MARVLRLNDRVTVEVLLDPSGHVRQPVNDAEISDRAVWLQNLMGRARHVVMVSGDLSQLFRVEGLGPDAALVSRPSDDDG